jgi:hypothetical protein
MKTKMAPYKKGAWRPSGRGLKMGSADAAVMGLSGDFVWGVGGAGAGVASAIVLDQIFPRAELPTTILGPFASAFVGYLVLDNSKKYSRRALPWAIGSVLPAAAYMIWGMFAPRAA